MATYLETTRRLSEHLKSLKDAATRVAENQAKAQWTDRLTPLEDRLAKLLANMPESMIRDGLSLDALRRLLAGKWRGHCHPGELGAALRKLGYVRRRSWYEGEGGFRAKWHRNS